MTTVQVLKAVLVMQLTAFVSAHRFHHQSIFDIIEMKGQQNWTHEQMPFVPEDSNSLSVIYDVEHYNYLRIFARLKIGDETYDLSPSTSIPDTFLQGENCLGCGRFSKGFNTGIGYDDKVEDSIPFGKLELFGQASLRSLEFRNQDNKNVTMDQFRFFTVQRGKGLEGLLGDGLLGLGMTSRKGAYSIIDQLMEKDLISKRQFSLFISDPFSSKQSQLVIGNLNSEVFKNSSDIMWVSVKEQAKDWTIAADSFAFDNDNILAVDVEITTDIAGLILNIEIFDLFVNYLLSRGIYCRYENRLLNCYAMGIFYGFRLPEIILHVQGQELHIPSELLLLDAQDEKPGQIMRLSVSQEDISGAVVGLALLRRYATVFDLENRKIGFYDNGYKTLKLMRELKFQLNLYNLMFAVMFGIIIAHFMIMGIKAIHVGAANFNFFEVNYFN